MRSMQIRSAVTSPCLAFWIILRIRPSASPSRSCSASTVAALRAPGGRPRGLPLWPFGKGRPRCFGAILPIDIPILSREATRPRISGSYLDVLPQNADSWKSTSYSRCQLRQGDKENGARMPIRSGFSLLRIRRRPSARFAKLAFVQRRKAVLFEFFGENFADYCRLIR